MKIMEKLWPFGKSAIYAEVADRPQVQVSDDLTPQKLDCIMKIANSGDPRDQCSLAAELLEKNHDIIHAYETRKLKVTGCSWDIIPAKNEDSRSAEAAKRLKEELDAIVSNDVDDGFSELIETMHGALIPGFSVNEILWQPGGSIGGFKHIEQRNFTFTDGFAPKLIALDYPRGFEIPRRRIVYHRLRVHGNDPARGGLIRPLAWLHCFQTLKFKDLLAFLERHGMPFVFLKADQATYEKERNMLKRLIRNFGSSGGGIIGKNVEAQLLECTSTGDVYFKLLAYCEAAITKVLLGQTASSGDSSGLSGGDAQTAVRQDIFSGDCRWIERSINAQLFLPWTVYNFGPDVAAPKLKFNDTPPEDATALSALCTAMYNCGFELDANQLSERLNLNLVKRVITQPSAPFAMSDTPESLPVAKAAAKLLLPAADQLTKVLERDDLTAEDLAKAVKELKFGSDDALVKALTQEITDGLHQ